MFLAHSLFALLVSTSAIATPVVNSARCEGSGSGSGNGNGNCTQQLTQSESAPLTSQWASVAVPGGIYALSNNLWGQSADPSGTQTTQLLCADGDSVSWQTQYSWGGNEGSNVKSYPNVALETGLSKSLQDIKAIPSSWDWSYEYASSDLTADVSYDLWLSDVAGSWGATPQSTVELMIWLSSRGHAGPAGYQVAVNLTLASNPGSWSLSAGMVENWRVFSFVADQEINKFNGDLMPFFDYLVQNQSVPASSLLVRLQSGTEPFGGDATLKTHSFTAAIN